MEWLDRMNDALGYLEANLAGTADMEHAARLACCSVYHFGRMFSYIAGVPLSEYLRRRRMTLAAFDLQNGGRVLDVALRYGYESPTAFNRAFQSVHGVSPSAAQRDGAPLKAYPRISFKITVKGEAEMDYRIIKQEAKEDFLLRSVIATTASILFSLGFVCCCSSQYTPQWRSGRHQKMDSPPQSH